MVVGRGGGAGVRHTSAASFTGIGDVHCLFRRRHGHLSSGLPPSRPHRAFLQVLASPTLVQHAAWGATAALDAYHSGWYIEVRGLIDPLHAWWDR